MKCFGAAALIQPMHVPWDDQSCMMMHKIMHSQQLEFVCCSAGFFKLLRSAGLSDRVH